MPKNLQSAKLSHDSRNDLVWALLKKHPEGLSRQQISAMTQLEINQTCSAIGNFMSDNRVTVVGKAINELTGIEVELLGLGKGKINPPSRKGELKRLRSRVQELEKNQALLIGKLKQLLLDASK